MQPGAAPGARPEGTGGRKAVHGEGDPTMFQDHKGWMAVLGMTSLLAACSGTAGTPTSPSATQTATAAQLASHGSGSGSGGSGDSGRGGGDDRGGDDHGIDPGTGAGTTSPAPSGASLRLRCEVRQDRSKISVDARDVAAGSYTAQVTSGGQTATAAAQTAVRGEVEFDFDSDRADIAAGATAIAPAFISNGQVAAAVRSAAGIVVASGTATCEAR